MTAETSEIALQLDQVSLSFGRTAALSEISLAVRRGEVVSLVGHSGCGKSSLLRIVAGLEIIDRGRLLLAGREVTGPQTFIEPERRSIGFVFQDYALFPHLSVRDNILFGLKRLSKPAATSQAAAVMERVGITHLAGRFPHTLSGGEQQRVALARALAPRPQLLLLDEPFSNLDQGLRDKVRIDTLALLKSLGTTVIMVTHDPEEALSAGDRVVLMRGGRIVQAGTAYDLYDRPVDTYAAEFFCAFNKVPAIYRDGWLECALGRFERQTALAPGAGTILYIRPQSLRVTTDGSGVRARIEQRIFHGAFEQVVLRVEGLDMPVTAQAFERLPQGVDTVRVAVAADAILLF